MQLVFTSFFLSMLNVNTIIPFPVSVSMCLFLSHTPYPPQTPIALLARLT